MILTQHVLLQLEISMLDCPNGGLDKKNNVSREISFLTSSAGYSQLIDQPTHITKESSYCINLIFTSSPSFISTSGVELSLYEKCHQNLIYGKKTLMFLFRHRIYVKFGITKMQR